MPPEFTPPAIPNPVTEAVAAAMRTYEVATLHGYSADRYRVVSGNVAFGGDHDEPHHAQAACDLLNANAAILAHLLAIRVPGPETIVAMTEAVIDRSNIWTAAIDQLIASAR